MSGRDRPSTTRLMALAAFILAAGLFSLRAYDTFGSVSSEPKGGVLEQELTYLLEPITGADKVRVSVTGSAPKNVLVMIDGTFATDLRPLRTRIETILVAAMAFDRERDTLTLSQFPYARGVGASLTPAQIAELTGLGLLTLLLLLIWGAPTRRLAIAPAQIDQRPPAPAPRQQARLPAPVAEFDPDLRDASALAEAKPHETAHLVRDWMSYAED
mgnify:CR=1 FL=1